MKLALYNLTDGRSRAARMSLAPPGRRGAAVHITWPRMPKKTLSPPSPYYERGLGGSEKSGHVTREPAS
jgi:hypothetical protein